MAQSISLTEADVHALATDQSFDRGYRYYRNDSVFNVIRRGNMVTAKVEGSDYDPYQVQVNLSTSGIDTTMCTCPYDWGGICKHIVATLLVLIHKDNEIETKPEVADLLNGLSEDQLRQVLLHVAEEGLAFAEVIEREVQWLQEVPAKTAVSTPFPSTKVDINAVRREMHKDFRLAGKGDPFQHGYYDEYAGLEVDVDGILQPHLEKVVVLLDAGDVDTAVTLITTIFEAFIDGLTDLDEWVYEYNEDVFGEANLELGTALAEIILSQTLSPDQEDDWLAQITDWEDTLGDLDIATMALEHGWTYPPLVVAMKGNITEKGAWEDDAPDYADELATVRLRILARRGETDAYINLAAAEGQAGLSVNMLAQSGQIERAVSEAKSYLVDPREILSLGKVLVEKGEVEAAFAVAEHGFDLEWEEGKAELAQWTRDQAKVANIQDLALKAAEIAFINSHKLSDYQAVQQLSKEAWPTIKPALLKSLQKSGWVSQKIDIYLHEKMLMEAMQALDTQGFASADDLHRVIEATRETHPNWGIGKCKRKAEAIMDEGRSKDYETAVSWLCIAQEIYQQHQRQHEWQIYLNKLLATHQRKYKLVPMLQNIRA